MKYGRRRKRIGIAARIKQLKRQHEREVREAALRRPAEHIVSIEIMCIALASFRTCDEWQALGWWGRWLSLWKQIARDLVPKATLSSLQEIYKRRYNIQQFAHEQYGVPRFDRVVSVEPRSDFSQLMWPLTPGAD